MENANNSDFVETKTAEMRLWLLCTDFNLTFLLFGDGIGVPPCTVTFKDGSHPHLEMTPWKGPAVLISFDEATGKYTLTTGTGADAITISTGSEERLINQVMALALGTSGLKDHSA